MSTPVESVLERLKLIAPTQVSKLEVKTQEEIGQLMHISSNPKITKFIPAISRRGAMCEDNIIPRVCVATTLAGSLLAYARDVYDFEELSRTRQGWIGGYVIYTFKYDAAVRPNAKLVYDVEETDEHWLVAHNEETTAYKPNQAGKMFCRSLSSIRSEKERALVYTRELFVEVYNECQIKWDAHTALNPGYYRITVTGLRTSVFTDTDNRTIQSISKDDYLTAKSLTASLLSFDEPGSAQW
jgi:hypothetical protein